MSESQLTLWGNTTGADFHSEIAENGYALLDHKIPPKVIDDFVAAYAWFTDNHPDPEPATMDAMLTDIKDLDKLDFSRDTQVEWNKYRSNTPSFAKPNGYTNRSFQATVLRSERGIDMTDDPKEFFHYEPGMREQMETRHDRYGWGQIPPELTHLLNKAHALHYFAKTAMRGFYGAIEATHPELAQFTRPEDLDNSPIRGLFYHKGQGDVLAGGHHDRGLATLQIAESHLGLRVRNPQTNEMDTVVRDPNLGIAFPALKWRQAFPNSEFRSLWHDVINIPTAYEGHELYGKNVARWSIIFFTNSQKIGEQMAKDSTHSETNALIT